MGVRTRRDVVMDGAQGCRFTLILGAATAAVLLALPPGGAATTDGSAGPEDERRRLEETGMPGGQVDAEVNQSAEEALEHDLQLTADSNGWTSEQAQAQHIDAEAVGEVAGQIAEERPDVFVGSALSEAPGQAPILYVKGPADAYVRGLVAAAPVDIVIADDQPYSFQELEERKLLVHRGLEALGFDQVATSVNIAGGGVIPAAVTWRPGLPDEVRSIVNALPVEVRDGVDLMVSRSPVVIDEQAFGGMWMRDDGVNLCTSGWSVRRISDNRPGVSTAGHCAGLNQIVHPGHDIHGLTYQAEHRGQYGDVEWRTSPEAEPDDFYADATTIRDVGAVEARSQISLFEPVCAYGRSSNDRDCLEVRDVSQACTNDGVFNDRLVLMNGDTQIGGDSGGGWSYGNTAFGSHKGTCEPDLTNYDAWSVASLYDEALGIRVTCGC